MNYSTDRNSGVKGSLSMVLLALGVSAVSFEAHAEQVTRTIDLEGIDRIHLRGSQNLTVRQGEEEYVRLTADSEYLDRIEAKVKGDTLTLGTQNHSWNLFNWGGRGASADVNFEVQLNSISEIIDSGAGKITLESIAVSNDLELNIYGAGRINAVDLQADEIEIGAHGAGKVYIDSATAEDISVTISGSGDIAFGDVNGKEMEIKISGAGDVALNGEGRLDELEIKISGIGDMQALGIVARTAEVEISGAGKVNLNVEEELDVRVSGSGTVRYIGNPEINKSVSGAGSVEPYED